MNASFSHLVVLCALYSSAASLAAQSWAPVSPTGLGGVVVADTTRVRLLAWGGVRGTLQGATWLDETWWVDAQGFQLAATPGAPAPLGSGWLAHDEARARTVLFGSVSPTGVRLNETWEHDGVAWQRILVGNAPPVPNDAALAYVPALGGCMLVTGNGQHWLYDGVTWQPMAIGSLPPSRTRFGLAFDPLRQRLVLFGGYVAQMYLADTWEFDGFAWTQSTPAASPPAAVSKLVFDGLRGRVLARLGESVAAQEWEYDGSTWSQLPMVASVPWNGLQQLGVNPLTGGAVLAAGTPEAPPHARFAELVGTSWIPWDVSVLPPAAFDARIARDVRRDRWLLFGGRSEEAAASANARAFQRSGGIWYPIEAMPSPSARFAHGFVHDEARDRTVLFGGIGPAGALADTWEFAAGQWSLRTNVGSPGARGRFGMAYDPLRQHTLLFGGQGSGLLASLWRYDGSSWAALPTVGGPSPRADVAMVHDAANDRMLVFGGETGSGRSGETWAYAQSAWTLVTTSGPAPRASSAMAYDPLCGCVVLHGGRDGNTAFADTWELRGSVWTQSTGAPQLGGRFGANLVADPRHRRLELFAGAGIQSFFGIFAPFPRLDVFEREPAPVPTVVAHGTGCSGSAGVPSLAASGGSLPALGSTFSMVVQNVPTTPGLAVFVLGTDITMASGVPLPQDLAVLGLPGCALWVAPEVLVPVATGSGSATLSLVLPVAPQLAGSVLATQVLALDAGPGFAGAVGNALVAMVH